MSLRTNGHLVATSCAETHSRTALACKMGAEFDAFLRSLKSWWCHFDDDNYVHVARLARLLSKHSAREPVYLGKPSTAKPLEIFDSKSPKVWTQLFYFVPRSKLLSLKFLGLCHHQSRDIPEPSVQ